MLGYYGQCDMAACGRISAGLTRPGLVRQKDKPVINGVVRGYSFTTPPAHLPWYCKLSLSTAVQHSTSEQQGANSSCEVARCEGAEFGLKGATQSGCQENLLRQTAQCSQPQSAGPKLVELGAPTPRPKYDLCQHGWPRKRSDLTILNKSHCSIRITIWINIQYRCSAQVYSYHTLMVT